MELCISSEYMLVIWLCCCLRVKVRDITDNLSLGYVTSWSHSLIYIVVIALVFWSHTEEINKYCDIRTYDRRYESFSMLWKQQLLSPMKQFTFYSCILMWNLCVYFNYSCLTLKAKWYIVLDGRYCGYNGFKYCGLWIQLFMSVINYE